MKPINRYAAVLLGLLLVAAVAALGKYLTGAQLVVTLLLAYFFALNIAVGLEPIEQEERAS